MRIIHEEKGSRAARLPHESALSANAALTICHVHTDREGGKGLNSRDVPADAVGQSHGQSLVRLSAVDVILTSCSRSLENVARRCGQRSSNWALLIHS